MFYFSDFDKLFQQEYRESDLYGRECTQEEWDRFVDSVFAKVREMHERGEIDASPIIDHL